MCHMYDTAAAIKEAATMYVEVVYAFQVEYI